MTSQFWITFFLGASVILCTGASMAYLLNNRPGMALAFFSYALANIGIIWDSYPK